MADSSPEAPPLRARLVSGARQAVLTGGAAWISYASTAVLGLREGYWAAISAIVVMQADSITTKSAARDRFVGTAIGGLIGWGCAACWHAHVWIYALSVGLTILICWLANIGTAGRLAAVAVTVIVLIPRAEPIWKVALFRFFEVSWGVAVAVVVSSAAGWLDRRRHTPSQ